MLPFLLKSKFSFHTRSNSFFSVLILLDPSEALNTVDQLFLLNTLWVFVTILSWFPFFPVWPFLLSSFDVPSSSSLPLTGSGPLAGVGNLWPWDPLGPQVRHWGSPPLRLLSLYPHSFGDLIRSYGFNYHFKADKSSVFLSSPCPSPEH